ncbi:MAG TPA: hypothetical protein PL117_00080 [Accumulibacter sp.]|uniref:hypothetical protein n=1 Tax=Accumulibacter sp. TaxID=2053492 RepID=UPI000EF06BA5|nr:hypothetical protein [Accumulibacter sp.]HCZ17622.1 hypothetical protein [Accumulibacter sp.]HRD92138.1 hypothetical protein [Accumulibacter sp.]HRF71145.1 hypothetical protein [Accumulibacter sp.]
MKLGRADWRKLQPGILLVVLAVAVGLAAVYFANQAKADAQKARLLVRAQLQEADGKLKQVRQEETEVKQKSIVFNKLAERGIIGDEQRLDWVELLKEIRDKHRLIDLQYEISPQRMLDKPGDDFSFFVSAMKIQLKLLHEEDLLRLIDDLRRQAKALVRVRSCQVERLPATGDDRSGGRAHLLADCEIDWLTLRDVRKK